MTALFQDAADAGERAVSYLNLAELDQQYVEDAAGEAIHAASLDHEAQREAGECPMCGSIYTDPWGGIHYNSSMGCCIEPSEPDGEDFRGGEAEAARWADQMATLRLKR